MGALKAKIHDDMIAAMKAHQSLETTVLRMVYAALKNAEVAGKEARELTDAEEIVVLRKEVSARKDAAESYKSGNRPELEAKELAEADIISAYLPASLSPEALRELVDAEIAALGEAPAMKHMGALVKAVTAKTDGRATGGDIAALVKAAIAG